MSDHPEPRYTEEQIREASNKLGITERLIREILAHFTQQPVGVGAEACPESVAASGSGAQPPLSADSDGNQQVEEAARELQERAESYAEDTGIPSAYRDAAEIVRARFGNQQPLGGGERRLLEVARTTMDLSRHSLPPHISEADHGRAYLLLSVLIERASQHPSGGQEAPKIERTSELLHECANAVATSRKEGRSEWATACSVIAAIERNWDGRNAKGSFPSERDNHPRRRP